MKDTLVLGNIITMNEAQPRAEALIIADGKISFVGSKKDAEARALGEVLDFGSRTVMPGFIDTHVHVIPAGIFMNGADLSKEKSISGVISRLREQAAKTPPKDWIVGAFFQDKDMEEKRFPTREELDSIAPEQPMLICHNDLHPIALNSRAMSMFKLDPKREGIITDKSGAPTGLIEDPACLDMLGEVLGKLGIANIIKGIMKVDEYAVSHGVTTVFGKDVLAILKLRELTGELLSAEFVPMWYSDGCKDMKSLRSFLKNKSFSSRCCVCAFADGAFDGHSAATEEPYSDRPDTCGMLNYTDDEMYEFTMEAHKRGVQVSFHAIGDAAIKQVLRVYERVLGDCPRKDHRLRIEHFEEPKPESVAKAAELGVALGMQPLLIEVCEHMDFSGYEGFIGERVKLCSPYKSVLDAGLLVGGGTDFPVTPMNVLHGARIAMTHPVEAERISLQQCLEINTLSAARLGFLEDRKGSLECGKDADIIVLDADPFEVPTQKLSDIKVLRTICRGKTVYDAEEKCTEKSKSLAAMLLKLIALKLEKLILR